MLKYSGAGWFWPSHSESSPIKYFGRTQHLPYFISVFFYLFEEGRGGGGSRRQAGGGGGEEIGGGEGGEDRKARRKGNEVKQENYQGFSF